MRFLARPFTWLVLAEVLLVAALGLATWHVVSTHLPATPRLADLGQLPSSLIPVVDSPPSAPTALATPTPRGLGPTPGLAMSSAFFDSELRTLNRDQAAWEQSEWTILDAGLRFARAYIESVVLPGIRSAESSHA